VLNFQRICCECAQVILLAASKEPPGNHRKHFRRFGGTVFAAERILADETTMPVRARCSWRCARR